MYVYIPSNKILIEYDYKKGYLLLLLPYMTSEVILHSMENLFLHNVSIHTIKYQNHFINECARENLAKILRCRKTYNLKDSL